MVRTHVHCMREASRVCNHCCMARAMEDDDMCIMYE